MLTALRDGRSVDGLLGPAGPVYSFVPGPRHRRTLGEHDRGIQDTGDGVEGNEAPEEDLPCLGRETMAVRRGL